MVCIKRVCLFALVFFLLGVLLIVDVGYAQESNEKRQAIFNGMTYSEFLEGWTECTGIVNDNDEFEYAVRSKELSDGTVLYEIWGKGECPGLFLVPEEGELSRVVIEPGFTSIAPEAFSNQDSIIDITLPEGITRIREKAFDGCVSITNIQLPSSVSTIGESAFANCKQLRTINLPNKLISIGQEAFAGCSSIERITTPKSTKMIAERAFSGCSNLSSLVLNGNKAVVKDYIIDESPFIETLVIGDGIKQIGAIDNSFKRLNKLQLSTNTKFVSNYLSGSDNIFIENKTVIQKVIYTGKGTIKSMNNPFISNRVIIKKGVKAIGESGLNFTRATSIIVPDSVTKIDTFAFSNCKRLKRVTLGKKVKWLKDSIFHGSQKMRTLILKTRRLSKKSVSADCFSFSGVKKVKVKVGSKKVNKKYIKKYKGIFAEKRIVNSVRVS